MLLAFNPRYLLSIKKEFIICFSVGAIGTIVGAIIAGITLKQFVPHDYWRISAQLTASYIEGQKCGSCGDDT